MARIADRRRVEHDDVGVGADADLAALREPELARGQAGHLVHRGLQRKQAEVAAVVPEHAGKCSPQTRMRMLVVRQAVGADHGRRILQDALDIVLAHLEVAGAAGLQTLARFHLAAAPFVGDAGERARRHFRVRRRPGDEDVDDAVDHFAAQHRRAGDVRIAVQPDRLVSARGIDVRPASRPSGPSCAGRRTCDARRPARTLPRLAVANASSSESRTLSISWRMCVV